MTSNTENQDPGSFFDYLDQEDAENVLREQTNLTEQQINTVTGAIPKGYLKELGALPGQAGEVVSTLLKSLGITAPGFEEANQTVVAPVEDVESRVDAILPTEDTLIQRGLERGGRMAPVELATGGLEALAPPIVGGLTGQALKSAGGGELGEGIGELLGTGAMGFLKHAPLDPNNPIVRAGRRFGLSDAEITPLIQGDRKLNMLAKIARRGERTERALNATRAATKRTYAHLEGRPEALKALSGEDAIGLKVALTQEARKLPSELQELIQTDIEQMFQKVGTPDGRDIMNLWHDINHAQPFKSQELGILKGPLERALLKLDPMLHFDFKAAQELGKNWQRVAGKLKPDLLNSVADKAELIGGAKGILAATLTQNFQPLADSGLFAIGRTIAAEMLLNQNFQNASKRLIQALNAGKKPAIDTAYNAFVKEVREIDDELADELDDEDVMSLFK